MAAIDDIQTAIDNIAAEMAAVSASPKPFWALPPGASGESREVSAVEYRRFLSEEMDRLLDLRARLDEPWFQSIRVVQGR